MSNFKHPFWMGFTIGCAFIGFSISRMLARYGFDVQILFPAAGLVVLYVAYFVFLWKTRQ